ncbi:hypothetical protein [Proteus hauseri]|uniref:hypothetical protein n=1 Tax=Proteus hauseri TaxID=183417 RepID=UPI00100959DF|nr:hypothetical protein [Proteus hauseri]QAV23090.1 hypothetical protein PH4a_06905 [Proteus hauseri]
MYDDISNLKDKFQEDEFSFQDFSSSITQEVVNKKESNNIIKEDNKKNNNLVSRSLTNKTFSETSSVVKNIPKQPVTKSIPSYHQNALAANKAEKNDLIKRQSTILSDNQIFDNEKTDKNHANEKISLKDILSFIASV